MNSQKKKKSSYKFLLTTIIVLLFLLISMNKYLEEEIISEMEILVGRDNATTVSLSVRENLILKGAVELYIKNIHSGDLKVAYQSLLPQYREHISEELFSNKMKEIGLENFVINSMTLNRHTENLFSFDLKLENDISMKILLLLKEKSYCIVPEPFLEYEEIDKEITKKNVTYRLKGYEVDLERCVFDMTLTNNSNDEIEITDVIMTSTTELRRSAVNSKVTLKPDETKEVSFVVETDIHFPKMLEVVRKDGDKVRVYTFEL